MKNYDETIESVFQRIEEHKTVQKQRRKMIKKTVTSLGSICLVVLVCVGVWKSGIISVTSLNPSGNSGNQGNPGYLGGDNEDPSVEGDQNNSPGIKDESAENAVVRLPKRDAGDLYVVAKDYEQISDILEGTYKVVWGNDEGDAEDTVVHMGGLHYVSENLEIKDNEGENKDASEGGYSKTNLQTAGVDESDIIKTDGSYIYTVNGTSVYITDVRNGEMKAAGEITVAMNDASDQIVEMYVDQKTVNLIVSKEKSELVKAASAETTGDEGTEDYYYFDTNQVTELLTYDITNPQNPLLKGSVTQEGYYQTSRKIGDMIYLFTNKYMYLSGGSGEKIDDWIPVVNGETIDVGCIYIPEQGNSGLVISSVDVQNPKEIVDNIMIIKKNVNIYVSKTAIYLYGRNYDNSNGSVTTEIAKFSMEKGVLNAVGAANVPGEVYDTFAVNEYQGKLRILTTDWSSGENENNLYLLDKNLNLTGKLEGLAPGEEIYSARFFQNMAYFVTYRNMDPLFAVDLSDETNPKVLSELKITGFSEYLHFWGEDKLVGIGYETDPETGSQEGLKVTMFDISNPADLKTAGTCVLKDLYYSPALYNYKCVLVDEGENLVGFGVESGMSRYGNYLLFAWEDGKFVELMTEDLDYNNMEQYRGIYINDMFYLAHPKGITSFDRTDGYKMVQRLEF